MNDFDRAWDWRTRCGMLEQGALRVFYGPGEGSGARAKLAIDRFVDRRSGDAHYWITGWESGNLDEAVDFLRSRDAASVVALERPKKGVPGDPVVLFGKAPSERLQVEEQGARYWIELGKSKHPGLFLDHAPLRARLMKWCRGMSVLNTFSYTGSLSVAAGLGGASRVTTLDLSKPTLAWAEENWKLNGISAESRFIFGDYFEWLPRLKREGSAYDCVILDPPSFSRGKKGTFSTAKDLRKLHELAIAVLKPGGLLVTSINSESLSEQKYWAEVMAAAKSSKRSLQALATIDLPETFPTRFDQPEARYLKGWVLKSS